MCDSYPTALPAPNPPRARSAAFTLVELLVVISIIGVVVADIALPTLSSMTQASRATKCLGNLKQLGAATFLYAGEHDGKLPDDRSASGGTGVAILYPQFIWPYAYPTPYVGYSGPAEPVPFNGTIFQCPQAAHDPQTAAIPITSIRSYAMDYYMGDGDTTTAERLTTLPGLPKIMMFCDHYNGTIASEANLAPRHRNLCNAVFCDGHAEAVVLTPSIRGQKGYHKDPFWGDLKYNPTQEPPN